MKLDNHQIQNVAKLANLKLSDDQVELFSGQLSTILDYIDQLNTVDTEGIDPTFNVTGLSNILQADQVSPSLTQQEAVSNGTNVKDGFFVTKGVFEDE